jgi:hypothetical protein
MNMNFKMDLDLKKWLPIAQKLQPYVFGALLVGLFGYTAYTVNSALNVKPIESAVPAVSPTSNVSFDKQTIDSVKKLEVVQGTVPTGDLGTNDPFN